MTARTCDVFFHANPKEIMWIVSHRDMGVMTMIAKFGEQFPDSRFMLHCLYSSCKQCEEKLKVLVGLKDGYGNPINNYIS